jgi:hypothetical protein
LLVDDAVLSLDVAVNKPVFVHVQDSLDDVLNQRLYLLFAKKRLSGLGRIVFDLLYALFNQECELLSFVDEVHDNEEVPIVLVALSVFDDVFTVQLRQNLYL